MRRVAFVVTLALMVGLAGGCSAAARPAPEPFRFFSPSSVWNRAVPADAVLDPSSPALVRGLAEEVASERGAEPGPWINTTSYSVPIYTVAGNQPTVEVQLDHAPEPTLSAAWQAVPLPPQAQPASGTDGDLVVWQPSTDRMWEFWRMLDEGGRWSATWGGAMLGVSRSSGVYGHGSWPGAEPWWGVSASSLAIVGGLVTLEDFQLGRINHALVISLPNVRADVYAAPAKRTDGQSTSPLSLPEGAHLRLEPHLNLNALHLPRPTLLLARAAQRYGIVVGDFSPNVAFYAQDPIPTGTEPYAGRDGYFDGYSPGRIVASFPWRHLQLLKMTLHG